MAKAAPAKNTRTAAPARQAARVPTREAKPLPAIPIWAAAGVFILLTFIFHSSILFGTSHLWEDFIEQEFPFRNLAASTLAQGMLPHWDPYIFGGMPFLADIQAAFWYPTNLLQTLLVTDGHVSAGVMEWFILMHYAVAGLGMFLFVKKIVKLGDWPALFAGITYAFSGYIAAQAIHQMIVYHIALFPWVAFLFVRGLSNWRYSLASGVLLGIMYFAGHPQSTLYYSATLGVIGLYELYRRSKQTDGEKLTAGVVLRALVPVAIGVGIFAIQLLPSNELAQLSRREAMTYEKSLDGQLSWGNLLTLVLPRLFGVSNGAGDAKVAYWNGPYYMSWEAAIYIGIIPLFFALLAAFTIKKQKYLPLFAGIALVAVLFSLGEHFILYRLFFLLPLFNKLRTPSRMMMVFSFAMPILAAMGLSEAIKGFRQESKRMLLIIAGLIALIWLLPLAGIINAKSFLATAPEEASQSMGWAANLAAIPVLATVALALALFAGKVRANVVAFGAIAVTIFELFTYGMNLNASTENPVDEFHAQPNIVSLLQKEQARELSRGRTRDGNAILLKRNDGAYDRIQLMEGYNPLVLQRVSPETANPEASADLMNIKWSIFRHTDGKPDFGVRQTFLPRAKMYYKVDVKSDTDAIEELKSNASYDYRNTLLLEEQPKIAIGPDDPNNVTHVTSYGQNSFTVGVKTATNGMLWLSEVYYPAWKAFVDGTPAKVYRAFTSLRAIEVPAGTHTITMEYDSDAFNTGSKVTIATLCLALIGIVATFFARKSPAEPSSREST